jgi:hypothetical protein
MELGLLTPSPWCRDNRSQGLCRVGRRCLADAAFGGTGWLVQDFGTEWGPASSLLWS